MKVALIADVHIGRHNISECYAAFDNLHNILAEQRINVLFLLGDLFDKRTSINGQSLDVLQCAKQFFIDCAKRGVALYYIAGNHDKTDLDSEDSYIDIVGDWSTQHLYNYLGDNIKGLDYYREDKYTSVLSEYDSDIDFLVTHIGINGVLNNDGSKHETVITPELFSDYKKVFVGHYHDAQFIEPNIYYIGSFIQHNFGEKYLDKGVTLLDTDTGATVKYHCGGPQYITIECDAVIPNDLIWIHNAKYRIIFNEAPAESLVVQLKEKGVKVVVRKKVLDIANESDNNVSLQDFNLYNELDAFCMQQGIKKSDKGFLLNFIKEL